MKSLRVAAQSNAYLPQTTPSSFVSVGLELDQCLGNSARKSLEWKFWLIKNCYCSWITIFINIHFTMSDSTSLLLRRLQGWMILRNLGLTVIMAEIITFQLESHEKHKIWICTSPIYKASENLESTFQFRAISILATNLHKCI